MPKVLEVLLYDYDIPTITAKLIKDIEIEGKSNKLISATGAHGMVTTKQDKEFKEILNSFYCNLPDGMPGVWVGRLKGAKNMQRCYGPDFFKNLMIETAGHDIKHFFCGGKEGVAEQLKKACGKKFNNHNVVGVYCPPFREMTEEEMNDLGQKISESGANIVWIGLSTPKQEKFSYRLKNYTSTNYIIAVGAAFDFHTDQVKQSPKWMQNNGLEWFFRLMTEPKRLYKRYLTIVPLFIYYNLKELITK
ncbi:MAG: glycosyltransferase [Pedobacter sp.]|nr:MAG: glycosyltransferase [Pedobacter sp.]